MLTHKDPKTDSGDKLGEGIDLETALKIFTINGAMDMMHEDVTGSIDAGKAAYMIILSHNLFEISETDIDGTEALRRVNLRVFRVMSYISIG